MWNNYKNKNVNLPYNVEEQDKQMVQDFKRKLRNSYLLYPEFLNQPEKLESHKNFSFDDMNKVGLLRKGWNAIVYINLQCTRKNIL